MTQYPFDFSVVMAVYNVAPFLDEAVQSLVAQDFDFSRVQLILVDDGSTDGSGALCDEYARLYPDNVTVIHKENGGVSSARNAGLAHVKGRFVNFLDGDDKLSENTLSAVFDFFQAHESETDVVSIPIEFFEGMEGAHMLNGKFNQGNRVIDLYQESSTIQLSSASSFIKASVLAGWQFDQELEYTEDGKLLLQIFLTNKATLGVVSQPRYLYRKRMSGELSAIQSSGQTAGYYLPWIRHYCKEILALSKEKLGYVPSFVQYALAYDLQARYNKQQDIPEDLLTVQEAGQYFQELREVLGDIDDEVILAQRYMGAEHKYYMLAQKYGRPPEILRRPHDLFPHYGGTFLPSFSQNTCTLDFLTLSGDRAAIEGSVKFPYLADMTDITVKIKVNGSVLDCEMVERPDLSAYQYGDQYLGGVGFRCSLPLDKAQKEYTCSILLYCMGVEVEKHSLSFGRYMPFGGEYESSYYRACGWAVFQREPGQLVIRRCGPLARFGRECRFLWEIWRENKLGGRKAILPRIAARFLRLFKRKRIWLISDKADRADDNGEALFLYLRQVRPKGIKPYFLIGKGVPDEARLKKVGKTIPYMSWRHKFLYLLADLTISAYTHQEINNPFGSYYAPYRDLLYRCKYVCLQHGVIKNDYSDILNRYTKNMAGFVTSAQREWASIVENPAYGYAPENVWLTGMPRYDRLYHDEKDQIVIMPTWRRKLMGSIDAKTSRWSLLPGFQQSEYYRFYYDLLHHEKLLAKARELGYQINFVPHPVLFPYIGLFSAPDEIAVHGSESVYRDLFATNKLLVTDFSSVAFDFAYLRKPVVEIHFDAHHAADGYFDYEEDGFGEIEHDLEGAVARIIEYMENDCQLKDKYRKRIDSFFAFHDTNNCQRVYEKIMALEKGE